MKKFSAFLGLAVLFFAGQQLMAQQPKVKEATVVEKVVAPIAKPVDVAGTSTEKKQATQAEFKFEEETFNFGQIEQGDVVEHTFHFQNIGTDPLSIENVKVTCGCTTPSYSKASIAPSDNGEIQVKFNSRGKMGTQMKSVTIYYGADMPKVIYLKGEVKPKTVAPEENSGQ